MRSPNDLPWNEFIELMARLSDAKPTRLIDRPDSPSMHSLWEGRYTVAGTGGLAQRMRGLLRPRARRPEYVVNIDRSRARYIIFRLENASGDVVAEIHVFARNFKGMTYRELAAKAATVMLADLPSAPRDSA